MSQFVVPSWNLRHQRQDQVDGEEGSRPFHVQNHQNSSYVVPMSADHEVTELTWENGQLLMHGLSNMNMVPPPAANKPTITTNCGRPPADHTLESIVHQATCHHKHSSLMQSQKNEQPRRREEKEGQVQMLPPNMVKKRTRSETESDPQCGRLLSSGSRILHDLGGAERSACASAGATFCRDSRKDTTMVTWGSSFESPAATASFKTKTPDMDDSSSHGGGLENGDEEEETKRGTPGTCSTRRSRAAAVHNQSERRRRDRINQKMKALQKLVPNASKTDKASMLDEVIDYLKQLQAQVVHMMSTRPIMPQMMINPFTALPLPLAMQQQLQMSLLAARMGLPAVGVGLGMLDHVNAMARAAPPPPPPLQPLINSNSPMPSSTAPFLPPSFLMPPMIPPSSRTNVPISTVAAATATTGGTNNATAATGLGSFGNPYSAFLAQQTAENMEFYGKMAAMYRQEQANQTRSNPILPSFNQGLSK